MPPPATTLTGEQIDAVERVEARLREASEAVLVGPAGSGKTTLLRVLVERLEASGRDVVLAAPTGKAAMRLAQATGREATTLHRRLYRAVDAGEKDDELVFSEPRAATGAGAVLVVDEASMVGTELYRDVTAHRAAGSAVLWVGDREQLEPVEDRWGPDLARPTAALGTVHRHAAENPILAYATAVREGRGAAWRRDWPNVDGRLRLLDEPLDAAVDWAVAAAAERRDATVVTWTHQVRERINAGVRERLGAREPIVAGDRVLVRMNSGPVGVMNGEQLTVERAHRTEMFEAPVTVLNVAGHAREVRVFEAHVDDRGRGVWATRKRIGVRRWDRYRFLHLWYGHCLTVHAAQGSQWSEVAFVYGPALLRQARTDPEGVRRLVYTAVTRAAERLVVFQIPD